jgi:hypothetical protein
MGLARRHQHLADLRLRALCFQNQCVNLNGMDRSSFDSLLLTMTVMSVIGMVSVTAVSAYVFGRNTERVRARERFRLVARDSWMANDMAFIVNLTQRRIFTVRGGMLPDTVSVDMDGDRFVITQKALSLPSDDDEYRSEPGVIN